MRIRRGLGILTVCLTAFGILAPAVPAAAADLVMWERSGANKGMVDKLVARADLGDSLTKAKGENVKMDSVEIICLVLGVTYLQGAETTAPSDLFSILLGGFR